MIFTIKNNSTNSTLAANLQLGFKGSRTSKYVEICPDLDFKEHYIHTSTAIP